MLILQMNFILMMVGLIKIGLEYLYSLGSKWLEETSPSYEEINLSFKHPDVSVSTLNKDIQFSYNLVMITLFYYLEDSDKCENLHMIVAGTA